MKVRLILLVSLALLALIGSAAFYTVDEREHAILMYFGKPAKQTILPGLHLKWPIVHTVHKYDRRLRVFVTTAITQTLQDKKTVILQAYLCWRIADPLKFYEAVRYEKTAQQKLNDLASSALGSAISRYPITSVVWAPRDDWTHRILAWAGFTDPRGVKLPQIEEEMREYMNANLKEAYGITVVRFGINRLALPEANEKKVYERMNSERDVAASEYIAEGERRAAEIKAGAKRDADNITARAAAEATKTRAVGDAEAIRISQQAYKANPEFYKFWKTLEVYKDIFQRETVFVVPMDSQLMKYFRMPEIHTGAGAPANAPDTRGP